MCSWDQRLVIVAFLWEKLPQPQFYKDLTRKTAFIEGWSWFKFNNLGLALDTDLKFYTSVAKGLKLKGRTFWGLIPTFVEFTGKKLVGRPFWLPPFWIGLSGHDSKKTQLQTFFQKQSHIFPFIRFQKQSLIFFQKQPHVHFTHKNCQLHIFFQKQSHNLQHKNIFGSGCTSFHGFCRKHTHLVWRTLQWLWKHLWWFKNLMALYECHRPRHNAYHNSQIIRAYFARMSQRLDHRP